MIVVILVKMFFSMTNATQIRVRSQHGIVSTSLAIRPGGVREALAISLGFIEPPGHDKIALEFDNEGSIQVLRYELISQRKVHIAVVGSVPYHLGIHGAAERPVQEVTAQLRNCNMALEASFGCNVSIDKPIMEWTVERTARIINHHLVGHDGIMPRRRAKP